MSWGTPRAKLVGVWLLGSLWLAACSDAARPSLAVGNGDGAAGKIASGRGGSEQVAGQNAGGSDSSAAGIDGAGEGGSAIVGLGGMGEAAEAGSNALGGASPDPVPPVGDAPLCAHGRVFGVGKPLALSRAGDDLLQAITPDELTIAWKNGERVYVADWNDEAGEFAAAVEVAGGGQYRSVALSPDGLQLIGIKQDLTVVEQTRGAGQPFDDADPGAGDFEDFNFTRASVPLVNQELSDPVVGADDNSFFFSHYTTSYTGSNTTLFESRRAGGVWSFANPDLGELLYAHGQKRRVPTGISSDSLTLFYRDEVHGDFRAAWRVNTQVAFDYGEVLDFTAGVVAAAPGASCRRIYYSAPGTSGLDLFVAEASP